MPLDMWPVQATLPSGAVARDPPFTDVNATQYYGTVIANPATASTLPVLELYVLACFAIQIVGVHAGLTAHFAIYKAW